MDRRITSPMTFFDFQGLSFGILLACLSLVLLKGAGLVTGQTAGLALLLSYVLPLDFGLLFFVISLPFFLLGWYKRGGVFALRTFLAITGISMLTPVFSDLITFDTIDPLVAAIMGGACAGMAVIAMFRHNASAGGMSVLALIVEQVTGIKAGWFSLGVDALIFLAAVFVIAPDQVLYSVIGAAIMNMMIAWNFNIKQSGTGAPST